MCHDDGQFVRDHARLICNIMAFRTSNFAGVEDEAVSVCRTVGSGDGGGTSGALGEPEISACADG